MAAVAAVAISAPVLAQDDVKAGFETRYAQLRTAMEAHDDAAMGAIMAPDYAMTDLNGETHTRDQMRQMSARRGGPARPPSDQAPADGAKPASPKPERQVTLTVQSATVSGPVATVLLQTHANGSRTGEDGKPHTMEMTSLSSDTWVKAGDAWQLKASVQKSIEVKRDGEVVFTQG
ncbi:nuclear transport factor 2 family protein [Parablastomonas sp. CN1-191]|uniref:nuclear transport factor 2 family protein n=1 Tax=Parablastomonas sp. CN1-191 TaxID=3400908 RepID=UPI003BF80C93